MPSSGCLSGSCYADGADTSVELAGFMGLTGFMGFGGFAGFGEFVWVGAARRRTIRGQCCVARLPVRCAGGKSVAWAKIPLLPTLIFEKPLPRGSYSPGLYVTKSADGADTVTSWRSRRRAGRLVCRRAGGRLGRDSMSGFPSSVSSRTRGPLSASVSAVPSAPAPLRCTLIRAHPPRRH